MKKIAVIGAGFSGLAICWHLFEVFKNVHIDLFDQNQIAQNTSGSSTGLLHAFIGKGVKKSLYADEAIKSTLPLLNSAKNNSDEIVYCNKGIFRVAINADIEEKLFNLSKKYPEIEYLNHQKTSMLFNNMINHSGVLIKNAITVNPFAYLKGLFLALQKKGVNFIQKKVSHDNLSSYDVKIFCTGHHTSSLQEQFLPKYEKIKGQMLICKWPKNILKLKYSVCGNGHITIFDQICYLGSTYEHEYLHSEIDDEAFKVLDKIKKFFPLVEKLKVIDQKSGIRIKRKGHYFPVVKNIGDNCFIFSCLGSRGLLYHSYLAKKLVLAIKNSSFDQIPRECFSPND